jgi:cyclic pyranopterin phosphate synthase
VNVSLDTLDRQRFQEITGRDVLPQVLAGLDAAHREGLTPVKLNMVVMQDVNDDEIESMVAYCLQRQFTLRLIEAMPMGDTGRSAAHLDLQPIQARLRRRFGLTDALLPGGGPARYLSSPDGRFTVGFITPMSRHFCATCNRLRMGVGGQLYTCLGHEPDGELRSVLRSGGGAQALTEAIFAALARKPERHHFREQPGKLLRFMAATGG